MKLDGKFVPQANRPDRIVLLVERIRDGLPIDAAGLGIDQRQVGYYAQAARILGLISDKGQLIAAGRALLALDEQARKARLALAFEESECGRAWAKWSRTSSLVQVSPKSAKKFILDAVELHGETISRRASTLLRWWCTWMQFHPAVRLNPAVPRGKRKAEALGHTAVFDSGQSGHVVQALGPGTTLLRCATAYLSVNGYEILVEPLVEADLRLLVGSESTFKSVKEILERFQQTIESGPPTISKGLAIKDLHRSVTTGRAKIHGFDPRYKPSLHAKGYLFDLYAMYVTSANLSRGGLRSNIEIGYVVRDPEALEYYRSRFDELFDVARELTLPVLRLLEESWAFEPLVRPYLLYLRALMELFPRVPDLSKETDRRLADYQELITSAVLHTLLETRGALLVSPTGTGKTIMACYVAAVLLQRQHVRQIYVVCPNPRLKRMWEDEFHRFGLHPNVITHGIVQGKGNPTEGIEERLRRVLSGARETDLVIVDECHAFRNPETNGFGNLFDFVSPGGVPGKPRLLLLSATPFSKSVEDLNALLRLVDEPPLQSIADLAAARRVVNVTLPFIVKKFGTDGRQGRGTGLWFGDELRHFGRIKVRTVSYRSPAEDAFDYIANMEFRFRKLKAGSAQLHLFGGEVGLPDGVNVPAGFLRLTLMRRAESSPLAVQRSIERLLNPPEEWLVPDDPEKFRASLHGLLNLTELTSKDTKLTELVRVLKERTQGRRVLVFSFWSDTVEYLTGALRAALPEERIESLTGAAPQVTRGKLIRRFSPSSQGRVRRARRDDIDILIATDAIAEGENLQDADVVVNYDLPWTPLYLIQRVGRVDRPTKQVRDIEVWNFFPESGVFERQLQLWRRLNTRSELYDQMARTRVVGEHDRDLKSLDEHDVGIVREFYESTKDFELLRERYLPTSAYLLDRANASPEDVQGAESLPIGARSCKDGETAGTFALLRVGADLRCVFWPQNGGSPEESPAHLTHEVLLRHIKAERDTALAVVPDGVESELGRLVEKWAKDQNLDEETVAVVCAELIVATKH